MLYRPVVVVVNCTFFVPKWVALETTMTTSSKRRNVVKTFIMKHCCKRIVSEPNRSCFNVANVLCTAAVYSIPPSP